jgi:hypothetical protein
LAEKVMNYQGFMNHASSMLPILGTGKGGVLTFDGIT